MFDIADCLKSAVSAIKSMFDCLQTSKNRQSETEIINELKKLKECSNIAEKLIAISYKYFDFFSESDKKQFGKLAAKFNKYD